MRLKSSTLAAAVGAALACGMAGQAAANVYGLSSLSVTNFTINTVDTDGNPISPSDFNFVITNTATLNGHAVIENASCVGTFGGADTCNGAAPRLDAPPANAPGGTVLRTNNMTAGGGTPPNTPIAPDTMNLLGPGSDQYSTSDSVIRLAEILGDGFTETHQIAESELQTGFQASANAELKSTTNFSFTFSVSTTASMTLSFEADPDMFVKIDESGPGFYLAQANMNASFSLQKDGGVGFVNWNPQGTLTNDCSASGGPTCFETADAEDLNINIGVSTNPSSAGHSYGPNIPGFGSYGIQITGLAPGIWTLTLNAVTSTNLTRQVPEPAVIALLGIGLVGMGMYRRRSPAAV